MKYHRRSASPATSRHFDDVLYTHDGDNKGLGGAQHDPCRDAIKATFESFGLQVELDEFMFGGQPAANVVATQVGTTFPDSYYIVSGHYDTVGNPGADDDASGVAAVIEIARVLSQYDTQYTIKYIAWDREEQGKIGSTHHASAHVGDDIRGVVQLDIIAHDAGLNIEDVWGDAASAPLRADLLAAVALYGNGLAIAYAGPATFSDHAPFAARGYQAVAFVEDRFQLFGCYHSPCDSVDTPDYIDYDFASNLARTVAGHLADHAIASAPATCPGDITGDGVVSTSDLTELLGNFGMAVPPGTGGDFNEDGAVTTSDLTFLLGEFGCGE